MAKQKGRAVVPYQPNIPSVANNSPPISPLATGAERPDIDRGENGAEAMQRFKSIQNSDGSVRVVDTARESFNSAVESIHPPLPMEREEARVPLGPRVDWKAVDWKTVALTLAVQSSNSFRTKAFVVAIIIFLFGTSLAHLAAGIKDIAPDEGMLAWAIAIGIDALVIALELALLVHNGTHIFVEVIYYAVIGAALVLSAWFNSIHYAHGAANLNPAHWDAIAVGCFVPAAVAVVVFGLPRLRTKA